VSRPCNVLLVCNMSAHHSALSNESRTLEPGRCRIQTTLYLLEDYLDEQQLAAEAIGTAFLVLTGSVDTATIILNGVSRFTMAEADARTGVPNRSSPSEPTDYYFRRGEPHEETHQQGRERGR
jgi:hypothetical protein